MSAFDLESLLAPLSEASPCGESLVYDPAYMELEEMARPRPAQQMGDSFIPAEEPHWRAVRDRCLELLARTRDLRVMLLLAVSELDTDGLPGLHDALRLMAETMERYWDQVHPQLDPTDADDPTERLNILVSLGTPASTYGDPVEFVRRVSEVTLTNAPHVGRFSLRDTKVAAGEAPPAPPAEGEEPAPIPDAALITGAFDETDTDDLVAIAEAGEGAAEALRRMAGFLGERVGAAEAPDFGPLESVLGEIGTVVRGHLARRGVGEVLAAADGAPAGGEPSLSGAIRSREDVRRALQKICQYYESQEPSSPIPILLRRAERLVTKNFVDIVKDLTPGAIAEIETIGGESYRSE